MDNNRPAIIKELVVIVVMVALLMTAAGFLVRNVVVAVRSLDGTETVDDFKIDDLEKALRDLAAKLLPADGKKSPPAAAPQPGSPAGQAKQPAPEIKKGEITSVRFFEAGRDVPQPKARQFAVQFNRQARNIYIEIGIKNNRYQIADTNFPFVIQCFDPAGKMAAERKTSATAKKDLASGFLAIALGAAEAGAWKSGQYTVKVFFDGDYIGDYKFAIE